MTAIRPRLAALAVGWLVSVAGAGAARAHGVEPSILDVRIDETGRVDLAWTEPAGMVDGPGLQLQPDALRVELPAGCRVATPRASEPVPRGTLTRWSAECGAHARAPGAVLRVPGLGGTAKLVIVRVREPGRPEARIELVTGRLGAVALLAEAREPEAREAPGARSEAPGAPVRAPRVPSGATIVGAIVMVWAARDVRGGRRERETSQRGGRPRYRTALAYAVGMLVATATGFAIAYG